MSEHSGSTISVWMATAPFPNFTPLKSNETADVCIIGAGISGLTTAYMLGRAGKKIIVLDDGPIFGGETERTTAHISNALDDRYFVLEKVIGEKNTRFAAESHTAAINSIEEIVREEKIDCSFERLDGYLFVPPGESTEILQKEFFAAHRAGLPDIEIVKRAPLTSFDTGLSLKFPNQAQFHPLKYLEGLARAIVRDGGRIYTYTHAKSMKGGNPAKIETQDGFNITCNAIVVATNTPVNDWVKIHTKQAPYRTYVIGAVVPAGAIPKALYWDTLEFYHYVRLQTLAKDPTKEVLIIGGEDHKTGQADDGEKRFQRLEEWARERFPMIEAIQFRWSGQVMEPIDGMAFIGRNPSDENNVYIATGDSGHGMTHGTIAGILISDLIQGRSNNWESIYDPSRKPVRAAGVFTQENLNFVSCYVDWVTPGDVQKERFIPPDVGAVIRKGLKKLAAYRDEKGDMHTYSAVCPHLGCILSWNHTEKSWDCPCHGSRFNKYGKVINGPANNNLPKKE